MALEPADAADKITELTEEVEKDETREKFRNRTALMIGVLGAVLAVCSMGGDNAREAMTFNNIKASDTWAFYQAKNVRQTQYKLAADALKRDLAGVDAASPQGKAVAADLGKYEKTAARYESEPGGDGKVQLTAKAKAYEEARETAEHRHQNFDFAEMLVQLAIVLGSVSILALSRPLRLVAAVLGVCGAVLTVNGFLLLFTLPI